MATFPWKVSLHGGHSGEFCDHAQGSLRQMLEAAVVAGYHTFGVSEHAPRVEARFLYPQEIEWGWDVAKLQADFEAYATALPALIEEFADRLTLLCGFETEVVPADRYVELMLGYRQQFRLEYMVGSVHHVDEILIDGSKQEYERAIEMQGGLEPLAVRYYEEVAQMVQALKPEVVAHFDLIRKNAAPYGSVETPAIRQAAELALQVVREQECILELNTAGYRKGLGTPYPAPWIVKLANRMGIGFCFGDDSHTPEQVGAGLEEARYYLLRHGVATLTILTREEGTLQRRVVPLS